MRALCSKTHFHNFFNSIFAKSKICNKKACVIFKIRKENWKTWKMLHTYYYQKQWRFLPPQNPPFICRELTTCPTWLFRNFEKWKSSSAIYLHENHVPKNRNLKSHFAVTGLRGIKHAQKRLFYLSLFFEKYVFKIWI